MDGARQANCAPGDLSGNELAAEAVRRFGELRLQVSGSSMLPAILPGDELLVRRCGIAQAGPGDVVLFLRHRRLFAHRVVSRSGGRLVTQGDGLAQPDPCVGDDELLGKVTRIMRGGKPLPGSRRPALSGRIAAAVFRRLPIAGRLFVFLHGARRRAGA